MHIRNLCLFAVVLFFGCKEKELTSLDLANIKYHQISNEAEYLYLDKNDFKKASELYEEAFRFADEPYSKDIYHLGKCYAKLDKDKRAVDQFNQIPNVYYLLKRDSIELEEIFSNEFFKTFYTGLSTKKLEKNKFQQELVDTVDYFIARDGELRKEISGFPTALERINEFKVSPYGRFQEQFVKYVKENGYPGFRKVGSKSEMLDIVLVHLIESNKREIYPFLIEELDKGNIDPQSMGNFLGRLSNDFDNNPCQYYIHLLNDMSNCELGKNEWNTIVENRKKIGMTPYYLVHHNRPVPREKFVRLPWLHEHD